jgi:hypothetical protein
MVQTEARIARGRVRRVLRGTTGFNCRGSGNCGVDQRCLGDLRVFGRRALGRGERRSLLVVVRGRRSILRVEEAELGGWKGRGCQFGREISKVQPAAAHAIVVLHTGIQLELLLNYLFVFTDASNHLFFVSFRNTSN